MSKEKAIIYESELDFIAKCVLDYSDLETGGDYFGYWNKKGIPVIVFATGPGKNTTRTSASFYQDIEYLHKCGNFLNENYALEHIGSWHSHHKLSLNHPSGGDISTMKNALSIDGVDKFFISITNIIGREDVSINGFLFSKVFRDLYKETEWIILPNLSPVRKEINGISNSFFTKPQAKRAHYSVNLSSADRMAKTTENQKVELSENSFFDTKEGRKFLKREFEKINSHQDCKNVEIIQNADKTIAIAFNYLGKDVEIRYPNDFSDKNPNPIIIEKENEREIKTHIIEIEPSRSYFLRPFDLMIELSRRVFGIKIHSERDEKSRD